MEKIAITTPGFFPGEAGEIATLLLRRDFSRVHIRKPDATDTQLRHLLDRIPESLRQRITIHNAPHFAIEYGLGGIHLNSHSSAIPRGWKGLVSRSIHSLPELNSLGNVDYAFLSPIFPSISKQGYIPTISHADIAAALRGRPAGATPVYALGGVTPGRLPLLADLGFAGGAMLGAAWRPFIDPDHFHLQFITHPTPRFSVVEGARQALEGGCRWIQLRHKDADTDTLMAEGREIAALCRQYGATFIIDDHVSLVHPLGADGVHLGQNDMPVERARSILGPSKIIGSTANTLAHMIEATRAGADYIGLGPFRFTGTKANLSPILGLDGYRTLLASYTKSFPSLSDLSDSSDRSANALSSPLPVVAIGGITDADIPPLLATGVSGIALSSSILSDPSPAARTALTLSILNHKPKP